MMSGTASLQGMREDVLHLLECLKSGEAQDRLDAIGESALRIEPNFFKGPGIGQSGLRAIPVSDLPQIELVLGDIAFDVMEDVRLRISATWALGKCITEGGCRALINLLRFGAGGLTEEIAYQAAIGLDNMAPAESGVVDGVTVADALVRLEQFNSERIDHIVSSIREHPRE